MGWVNGDVQFGGEKGATVTELSKEGHRDLKRVCTKEMNLLSRRKGRTQ